MGEMNARVTPGIDSILDLNVLPWAIREQLYVRLVPEELMARFGVDRASLRNGTGEHPVRIAAPDSASWARVEVRDPGNDHDPVLLLDIAMSAFAEGGPLHRRLDDSTPFRRRGFETSVRGRSWAIHDGILEGVLAEGWSGVKMYRVPGRRAAISTFPHGSY